MTSRHPLHRAALAAGVLVVALAATAVAAGGVAGPAELPTQPADRLAPPTPAVVIGDSAISALRWVPGADNAIIGFEHTLDLESCRRLYAPSCRGREGRVPPTAFEALADHGDRYKIAVIATGYNDATSTFADSFRAIVWQARRLDYDQIVWWTLRSDVDYVSPGDSGNHVTFAQNNRILLDLLATGAYPDVVLADWGGYTADQPGWFVTDGVHYRAVGAWAAADYLSRKMAFLQERQCPMPRRPGEPIENPCPDPDETGPVADIDALYPIGEDGVLCYEIGSDHRIECRYDTHVIRIERELAAGMTGEDVEALQTRLIRLGHLAPPATGAYTDETIAAVTAFQQVSGLTPSGVADRDTLESLGFDVGAVG